MTEAVEPLPISALQHFAYCPRQALLIHLDGLWEENLATQRGRLVHARVAEPGAVTAPGVREERALPLWSDRLGLVGIADVVEFHDDGTVFPIEYKRGPRRPAEHDNVQLCAQAMCLEDMMGRPVPRGAIFHAESRRRRLVVFTPELRARVEAIAAATRAMLAEGVLPPPANDERCPGCSLREACQPVAPRRAEAAFLFEPMAEPEEVS